MSVFIKKINDNEKIVEQQRLKKLDLTVFGNANIRQLLHSYNNMNAVCLMAFVPLC